MKESCSRRVPREACDEALMGLLISQHASVKQQATQVVVWLGQTTPAHG